MSIIIGPLQEGALPGFIPGALTGALTVLQTSGLIYEAHGQMMIRLSKQGGRYPLNTTAKKIFSDKVPQVLSCKPESAFALQVG